MSKLASALLMSLILSIPVLAEEESSAVEKGHYFIAGYDLATQGKFTKGFSTHDRTETFDTELEFDPGFSAGYEYRKARTNAWGSAFGIIHSLKRDLNKAVVDGKTSRQTGSGVANVAMTTIYANALYKWKQFYLPFGITYNTINYKPDTSFEGSTNSTGGFGFNFALGWEIDDRFAIEYGARSTIWDLSDELEDNSLLDYGVGTLAVATLALKVRFL